MLAQKAAQTDAEVIVFCGVHFMGESAKILAPNKTVLIPDERAGCPMADMVNVDGLRKLKAQHPNAKVVTYINSSAEIKAETDICCTSSNAVKVIQSVDSDEIIWVPDKNLGHYVQQHTDKKLIIWEGYCNTHDMLTVKDVVEMKAKYPQAEFVVHPECRPEVVAMGTLWEAQPPSWNIANIHRPRSLSWAQRTVPVISFDWIARINRSTSRRNSWYVRI